MNFFSVEKHLFFQDSLMFHQEKLSYNLPAVKEDIKSVMNISAKGSADRLGLKKGQWISFLCPLPAARGGVRKQHSHPLAGLEGLVGFI